LENGDGFDGTLNFAYRVVRLLEELDSRRQTAVASRHESPEQVEKAAKGDTTSCTYDVFISHASGDKEAIARPLSAALVERGVRVWFDEATLELGDSLRRKIDEGLAQCSYGIVILSPRFLQKAWP
jgi:hypothetical protein